MHLNFDKEAVCILRIVVCLAISPFRLLGREDMEIALQSVLRAMYVHQGCSLHLCRSLGDVQSVLRAMYVRDGCSLHLFSSLGDL